MANAKRRTANHRRDRRKAKASNWKRGPKRSMNAGVSHGETGSATFRHGERKRKRKVRFVGCEKHESSGFSLLESIWEGRDILTERDDA